MGTGFHFEEGMPLFTLDGADIPAILVLTAAGVALEAFLALKKDGRLGLILPGLWLVWAAARLVVRAVQQAGAPYLADPLQALALAFAVENVPTLLMLAACGLCRLCRGWRTRRQLEKTRIDDL